MEGILLQVCPCWVSLPQDLASMSWPEKGRHIQVDLEGAGLGRAGPEAEQMRNHGWRMFHEEEECSGCQSSCEPGPPPRKQTP